MQRALFTESFDDFVAPARAYPSVWRIVVGMILIIGAYIGAVIAAFSALAAWTGKRISEQAELALFLGTFAAATFGVWVVVRLLHRRSFASIIGPLRPAWRNFCIAVLVIFVVQGVALALWSVPYDAIVQHSITSVLATLPLVALLTLIQTSAEEFVFRGYLMQQMAARFASPLMWFLVPQVLFAVLHYDPVTMGGLAWPVVGVVFVYALIWADLIRLTGNLGAACGWHFANNLLLFAWLSPPDDLNAFAWAVTPYRIAETPVWALGVDVGISLLSWAILRRALRR